MSKFCGKVLLFGEYSVVKGGKGLALPLFEYTGQLKRGNQVDANSESELSSFAQFLRNSSILRASMDMDRLIDDVEKGLRFESDIPQGAGVGSSGALCAAIYSDYQLDPDSLKQRPLSEVMDHLALMEAFYHGSSSGLDPLISFAQKPALVSNRNKVEFVELSPVVRPELFILNTNCQRKTSPLVHQFLKMCEDKKFAVKSSEFIDISDKLILAFLQNDMKAFDELFYRLSKWQYLNLKPMVCPEIDAIWLEGLESKDYYVKLCGAGGGGHYILYRRDSNTPMPGGSINIKF